VKRYSRQGLWALFLACAFPLHVWTIILAFRDFSWVSERTNSWDALGVVSYGLMLAFVESVFIFLVAMLLGYLVSNTWREEHRVTLMSMLVLLASLWAIAGYLFFMLNTSMPGSAILFMASLAHPLRFLYIVSFLLVGLTILIPTYFVLRSDKFLHGLKNFFERIFLLTMFYLFFDFIALVVVIIRNV